MKRSLVIVRAGDGSLHEEWLGQAPEGPRNFDLAVSYYGSDPRRFRAPGVQRYDSPGPKYPGLPCAAQLRCVALEIVPGAPTTCPDGTCTRWFDAAS